MEPLQEGEFSDALIAQGKKPQDFINEIRDKYDPIRAKKKTTSGGRGSGRSSNNPELADAPYDPCLCSKRVWNQGLGAQCQSVKMDGCEFCTRCTKEFGNKGALPFGYYDQEKPEEDLVTGKKLPWKTLEDLKDTEKKPKMKVGEIREKLEEMGLDTSGKKAELLERLEAAMESEKQLPVDVVDETPKKKKKKKMIKKKQPPAAEPIDPASREVLVAPFHALKVAAFPSPEKPLDEPIHAPENSLEEEPIHAPANPLEEHPVENGRVVEKIVAKNGQVLNLDLGPAESQDAAGTGLIRDNPDETIDIEEDEDNEEDEDDFDVDEFDEIDFEDVDYLYDEDSNKVYTMDGVHVGSWDDEEGIKWLDNPTVKSIKEANHGE